MTDVSDVLRQPLAAPTFASEDELKLRRELGGPQKELLNPRLSVRQAIADKNKIAREARLRRHGMVRVRIYGVVNWTAVLRAQSQVVLDDGISAAVSENKIVMWNQSAKRIIGIFFHAGQSCGRIHIPKSRASPGRTTIQDFGLKPFVVGPDAAVLDDQIDIASFRYYCLQIARCFIDSDIRIVNLGAVAIQLPVIDVGLGKCNLVAQPVQVFVNSAVVGRRAVPITRCEAGTEHVDFHAENPSLVVGRSSLAELREDEQRANFPCNSVQISSSCWARCAHVCRSRIVSSPFAASCCRARSSRSRRRSSAIIAAESGIQM